MIKDLTTMDKKVFFHPGTLRNKLSVPFTQDDNVVLFLKGERSGAFDEFVFCPVLLQKRRTFPLYSSESKCHPERNKSELAKICEVKDPHGFCRN